MHVGFIPRVDRFDQPSPSGFEIDKGVPKLVRGWDRNSVSTALMAISAKFFSDGRCVGTVG